MHLSSCPQQSLGRNFEEVQTTMSPQIGMEWPYTGNDPGRE